MECVGGDCSQNAAASVFPAFLTALFREKSGTCGMLENFSDAFVGFGTAFQVVSCTDLLLDFFTLYSSQSAAKEQEDRIFVRLKAIEACVDKCVPALVSPASVMFCVALR